MSDYPEWLKKRISVGEKFKETEEVLQNLELNTVCQAAHCPNIGECFSKGIATFMILGKYCTRNCRFCDVEHNKPETVDKNEPVKIAKAVKKMGLEHVVITSVTRDDLEDGGSYHFANTIKELKKRNEKLIVEVLTPDFKGKKEDIKRVLEAGPDIYNHNLETVPRLYDKVRPQANYKRSLEVIKTIKNMASNIYSKSGIMLGLGEKKNEVISLMKDLRQVDCDILTIGQYLQPSPEHVEMQEYIKPAVFDEYKEIAKKLGFKSVASSPLVRSSFNAKELFVKTKENVSI